MPLGFSFGLGCDGKIADKGCHVWEPLPGRVTDDLGLGECSCEGLLGNTLVFAEQREQRPEGNRREMAREVQSELGAQKDGIADSTSYLRALRKMNNTNGYGS